MNSYLVVFHMVFANVYRVEKKKTNCLHFPSVLVDDVSHRNTLDFELHHNVCEIQKFSI